MEMNRKEMADIEIPELHGFGARLKAIRLKNGMTMEQFGRRIGVSAPTIAAYESESRSPRLEVITAISQAYDCSVDFLLGVSTPESEPMEGYDAALLNVCAFRESWTRDQKLFLAYASMGLLSPPEENQLRLRLGV